MENLPPPNDNPNAPEEEPFMNQIPNNNTGWLEEYPEEEEEEEEENEAMVDDDEDDAEVINPYEEADPHNRPPSAFDEETEFAPPVIIMENVPPPNNNLNVLKEEPILDQAPATIVRFAPQWIGRQIPNNNNGWLEKDPKEEFEKEEIEDKDMVNDEEDDAEVINPYEEADPQNRPPSTFDKETEFAPPVVQIADADNVPIPPVIQFGRLSKQMHDRYMTEKKMARKLRQDELRMNDQEFDITSLDSAVRENRSKNSKMMKMITSLNGIEAAIRAKRERVRMAAPMARECSFTRFMNYGPTQFHGTEGAVGLVHWFKKIENTFEIKRFNEFALLCPDAVPNEKKKVKLYIKGLPEIIKGETTSSRPTTLNVAVRMAHALMKQKIQA
nr:hypothetical protein [Tanacetum cinerariifolium]